MINVTKPYLPNVETYKKYIDAIWESGHLTNNGQFCKKLEKELCDFLSVDNCIYVNNGTIALQIALKTILKNKRIIKWNRKRKAVFFPDFFKIFKIFCYLDT